MSNLPKILILAGDGVNCERETARAFEVAGGLSEIIHINKLIENPKYIHEFHALAFPGGFSFGDELGSGQILALKIKYGMMSEFKNFVESKKPILGICNGFQVLSKLGLLPTISGERVMALAPNIGGTFIDCWTTLHTPKNSVCVWTKSLEGKEIELPIRHGEGRIVFKQGLEDEIYQNLKSNGQIVFEYESDINGSHGKIAGVCDPSGLVLGMMPHPEAYIYEGTYYQKKKDPLMEGMGLILFKNIINFLNKN